MFHISIELAATLWISDDKTLLSDSESVDLQYSKYQIGNYIRETLPVS